jgi:hypothetical protein
MPLPIDLRVTELEKSVKSLNMTLKMQLKNYTALMEILEQLVSEKNVAEKKADEAEGIIYAILTELASKKNGEDKTPMDTYLSSFTPGQSSRTKLSREDEVRVSNQDETDSDTERTVHDLLTSFAQQREGVEKNTILVYLKNN